jgi:hypothetical protein
MVCATNTLRLLTALLPFLVATAALPTPNNGPNGIVVPPASMGSYNGPCAESIPKRHEEKGNKDASAKNEKGNMEASVKNKEENKGASAKNEKGNKEASAKNGKEASAKKEKENKGSSNKKQGSKGKPEKQCKKGQKGENCVVGAAAKNSTATPAKDAKVMYYITNDADNAIVALKVGQDGTLSDGSVTPTGGKGGNGIQKGAPAKVDPLFSQSAVRVGSGVSYF